MDRVLFSKSASSPSVPAASSAGASSVVPVAVSTEYIGLGQGVKDSLSGAYSRLPWTSLSTSAGVSTQQSLQPSCRPWERSDLLKRLSTFRPVTWSGKPKSISALSCARRGWTNTDVDEITCEACGANLIFTMPPNATHIEIQNASEAFAEKLDDDHNATCPWIGNTCSESLAQFPPIVPSALIGGYYDRCELLLLLSALPVISGSAIDRMKISRGSQVDRILAQQPVMISENSGRADNIIGVDSCRVESTNIYFQALRLISLCGWEPRLLPNVLDCEEHSAHSARNACSVVPNMSHHHSKCDPGPSIPLFSKSSQLDKKEIKKKKKLISETNSSPPSALLECSHCGATAKIWEFVTTVRQSHFNSGADDIRETGKKLMHTFGVSEASGIDGWCSVDATERDNVEGRDEAATTVEGRPRSVEMNLSNTIRETATCSSAPQNIMASGDLAEERDPLIGQTAGSEVGDRVASYESRGPGTGKRSMDERGSTVDRPVGRVQLADSMEGTVVDRDPDEVNDGSQYSGGPSKCARTTDSLALDNISFGRDISYLGPSHSAAYNQDVEDDGNHLSKKNSTELFNERIFHRNSGLITRDSTRASSVIAMDTCNHSMEENSMESVENFRVENIDDDAHGPVNSIDKNTDLNELSEVNVSIQAQQSTCVNPETGRNLEETSMSTYDEGDGISNVGNVRVDTREGFSIGLSGGSVGMGASHEAEIHGIDTSFHLTESAEGGAELLTEVAENQGQTEDFGPSRGLTGEFVPDDLHQEHALWDSHDVTMSHSVERVYAGSKTQGSTGGESPESSRKSSRRTLQEDESQQLARQNATRSTSDYEVSKEEVANADMNSGKQNPEDLSEFDPILHHHSFCPWINGNVFFAGCNDPVTAAGLCGWQLTLDAVDAYYEQGQIPVAAMESESAASLFKDDRFASVHKLFSRRSISKNCT